MHILAHLRRRAVLAGAVAASAMSLSSIVHTDEAQEATADEQETTAITNWSGTHTCFPSVIHYPETENEVRRLVAASEMKGIKLRPVGTALSPNGIAFNGDGRELVNLSHLDKLISVDKTNKTVTIEAGATVANAVELMRPYGLTLPNYASIQEQQLGGLTQVGAHGTGATIAPLDAYVVGMKLVTPSYGTLYLSKDRNPELFHFAKCGLGVLGVVTELTLKCVDAHKLLETTQVLPIDAVTPEFHRELLRRYQHVRYMWLPYCDHLVVVTSVPITPKELQHLQENGVQEGAMIDALRELKQLPKVAPVEDANPLRELRQLLIQATGEYEGAQLTLEDIEDCSFAELRDRLIALNPLDVNHIIRVNQAECSYWKGVQGYRLEWSDKVLGFECGGQQWVSEVAFPCGSVDNPDITDLKYTLELLRKIYQHKIAAPAPIEQRWTRASDSALSIVSSDDANGLFSWVGIIMYMPKPEEEERQAITNAFSGYKAIAAEQWEKYKAFEHWAKLELPEDSSSRTALIQCMKDRLPLAKLSQVRRDVDPHNVHGNALLDTLAPIEQPGPPVGSDFLPSLT